MGMMEKLKVDRVWCDEIFYRNEEKNDIQFRGPAGTALGANPTITGEATTAVLSCELRFVEEEDQPLQTFADVEIMVQEELTVIPEGQGDPFDLEYAFRFRFDDLAFQKCQLDGAELERLKCQIFRLESDVMLENVQVPDATGNVGTFNNVVRLMLKIKVDEEVQTFVALGTAPNVVTRPIATNNG